MTSWLRARFSEFRNIFRELRAMNSRFDQLMMSQGTILSNINSERSSNNIQDFEFKVFSQFGEDGILQKLTQCLPIKNRTFVEFGVEDFFESNCRFLMMHNNWEGFVIDGSSDRIKRLRAAHFFLMHQLEAVAAFVNAENINELLARSGFDHDLGILSIDIDGVDYWVLKAISGWNPCILIVEYNAIFGAERAVSVPYDPLFIRSRKHSSNLYWGASLPAFDHLAKQRGYSLIGTNTAGCNAFFVRNDLLKTCHFTPKTVAEAFTLSRFRDSRGTNGELTYVGGKQREQLIQGLPVVNVVTGENEII